MTYEIKDKIREALGKVGDRQKGITMGEVALGDIVPGRGRVMILDKGIYTTLHFENGNTLTLRNDVRLLVDKGV